MNEHARLQGAVVWSAFHEESGREGSDAGAWFGGIGRYGGAGGEDGSGDVGPEDRGIGVDGETEVSHEIVDGVESDGLDFDE